MLTLLSAAPVAGLDERLVAAKAIARAAGGMGMTYFRDVSALTLRAKGTQDLVSNADLEVERFVRAEIADAFPDDGIVGEEYGDLQGPSGWTWVIDPIDGTANFVRGIPAWCVIVACVCGDATQVAAIYDPCHDELYWAARRRGAYLNAAPMRVSRCVALDDGSVGVGVNARTPPQQVETLIGGLMNRGGLFYRNASGGLMLSYVAAGRLIAYVEPHMMGWDCLAGQLLVAEAGGSVEAQSAAHMLNSGGRVLASAPGVFDALVSLAEAAFASGAHMPCQPRPSALAGPVFQHPEQRI